MRRLDVWYPRLDVDEIEAILKAKLTSEQLKRFRKSVREGADQGQPEGIQEAGQDGRRPSRGS